MNDESERHLRAAMKEFLPAPHSLTDACIERLEKKMGEEGEGAEQARPSSEDREED